MAGTTTTNQSLVLRRAIYIHVSDIISAYNIDHVKLEEELARVRDLKPVQEGIPTELDTSLKRLQVPREGFNACVLVGKVQIVVEKKRVDGTRLRLAEVEVGDETGIVSLRARDEQIDLLQDISQRLGAVVLRNCTLELYQGKHIRLTCTKWGKISPYPDGIASTPPPPTKINHDRKFSSIDLRLVASDIQENVPFAHNAPHEFMPGRGGHFHRGGGRGSIRGRRPGGVVPMGQVPYHGVSGYHSPYNQGYYPAQAGAMMYPPPYELPPQQQLHVQTAMDPHAIYPHHSQQQQKSSPQSTGSADASSPSMNPRASAFEPGSFH